MPSSETGEGFMGKTGEHLRPMEDQRTEKVERTFPREINNISRSRGTGIAISPGDWSLSFQGRGGEDGKYKAREVGWSQIIGSIRLYIKHFGLCSKVNGSYQKL